MNRRLVAFIFLIFSSAQSFADEALVSEGELKLSKEKYKRELIMALSAGMGKAIDPDDPQALQAAEAFFVIDASKSYAFTRIHAIALEFCPENAELRAGVDSYQRSAHEMIRLGEHYYREGFDLQIGEKRINPSGKELTDSLNGMLEKMRKEYSALDAKGIKRKCKESTEALKALTMIYGG